MHITGGKVVYTQKRQVQQFEPVEATVELSFALDEGEAVEGTLDHVSSLAKNKALEMIGLKKADPAAAPKVTGTTTTKAQAPKEDEKTTVLPPKGKTKADLEAEQLAKLKAADKKEPKKMPAADPAAMEDEKPQISTNPEDRKEPEAADPAAMEDDLMSGAPAEAVVITDADLQTKIMQRNAAINNPIAIRQLIAKYVGAAPKTARDMTNEQRTAFVIELEKL